MTNLPPEVKEAVDKFLGWDRILNHCGCMGGWGSRPERFEKDVRAGIVLANYITQQAKQE